MPRVRDVEKKMKGPSLQNGEGTSIIKLCPTMPKVDARVLPLLLLKSCAVAECLTHMTNIETGWDINHKCHLAFF